MRMPLVRVAPDLFGLLRMQGLEGDRVHRRDRGELDKALDVDVMKLRGNGRERVEPRHEELRGAFGTGELGHVSHLRGPIGWSSHDPCGPGRCQARDWAEVSRPKGR